MSDYKVEAALGASLLCDYLYHTKAREFANAAIVERHLYEELSASEKDKYYKLTWAARRVSEKDKYYNSVWTARRGRTL